MSSEEKLMPCECGGDAVLFQSSDGDVEYVQCLVCAREGSRHYSCREAIAGWNLRPLPPEDGAPRRIRRFSVHEGREQIRYDAGCSCLIHARKFTPNLQPLSIASFTEVTRHG